MVTRAGNIVDDACRVNRSDAGACIVQAAQILALEFFYRKVAELTLVDSFQNGGDQGMVHGCLGPDVGDKVFPDLRVITVLGIKHTEDDFTLDFLLGEECLG